MSRIVILSLRLEFFLSSQNIKFSLVHAISIIPFPRRISSFPNHTKGNNNLELPLDLMTPLWVLTDICQNEGEREGCPSPPLCSAVWLCQPLLYTRGQDWTGCLGIRFQTLHFFTFLLSMQA